MATPVQIVIDSHDPDALAGFWAEALGYIKQPPPEGYDSWDALLDELGVPADQRNARSAIIDPDGAGPRIFFQRVPEKKEGKNRIHLDMSVGGPAGTSEDERRPRVDAEVTRLEELGATTVQAYDELGEHWVTMRDPEGNEFDVQ
ncbi:MAG: VOC family protein [Actinomycetota bacterium]